MTIAIFGNCWTAAHTGSTVVDGGRIIMFQALFFQERDAIRDLIAHKNNPLKSRESPPRSPTIGVRTMCPDARIKKESTEAPFIGEKVS
jgi:hypothetical protein